MSEIIFKEDSIDLIGDLIKSLTFPIEIKSVVNTGGGKHTLTVCNMYHAQPGFKVTIAGKSYLIKDITPGSVPQCATATLDVMKIEGDASNIVATTFDLYKPHFFHGTPIAQGVELSKKTKAINKVPMAWFYEQFTDKFFESELINKEREIRFRLFFLTQADPDKWFTDDAYKYAIRPMHRLAEYFIEKLKSMPVRFDVDNIEFDMSNYAKFGVFISNRGMDKKLWHDNLAGVEVSFSPLTVYKKNVCLDC